LNWEKPLRYSRNVQAIGGNPRRRVD
jgi:hypothetical protein